MSGNRNRRPYDSSRRREQARATRQAILDAAHRLFVADGYATISIRAIAAEAGVAEPTVYAAFKNKPSIVWAIAQTILVGDEEGAPLSESEIVRSIRSEPRFDGRLQKLLRWAVEIQEGGLGDLERVVTEASAADLRLTELVSNMDAQRRQDDRFVAGLLQEVATATVEENLDDLGDFLGAVASPTVYDFLVKKYGWSAEKYTRWMTRFVERMFNQPPAQ